VEPLDSPPLLAIPLIGDHTWVRNALLSVDLLHVWLGEERVHLDPVDRRHDLGSGKQLCQHVGHEVTDTDRADLSVSQQLLQYLARASTGVEGTASTPLRTETQYAALAVQVEAASDQRHTRRIPRMLPFSGGVQTRSC